MEFGKMKQNFKINLLGDVASATRTNFKTNIS